MPRKVTKVSFKVGCDKSTFDFGIAILGIITRSVMSTYSILNMDIAPTSHSVMNSKKLLKDFRMLDHYFFAMKF